MAAQLLGAHMPIGKGIGNAVRAGKAIGCTAIQVFTKSPQIWKSKPVTDEVIADFKAAVLETGITEIVSHDSYLINMAGSTEEGREKSIVGLIEEINRCSAYGIPYVNSHMGSHIGQGEEIGQQLLIEGARRVLAETDPSVMLLMETTSGQGSALGATFEQLAFVLDGLGGDSRVGVCVDTCHIFAAGYDIRSEEAFGETFGKFESVVGFDRLKAVHCNDSLGKFGSHKDRHAANGEGEIGETAFRLLVNDTRFDQIPILLETPMEDGGHERDLAKLISYRT